jgi:hypothetical protein
MDESITLRNALPKEWPKPLSKGSITILEWLADSLITSTRRGFKRPTIELCII